MENMHLHLSCSKSLFAYFPLVYICTASYKLSAVVTVCFSWWHFSMVEILWWNILLCSSLMSPKYVERNPYENERSIFSSTCCTLSFCMLEAFAEAILYSWALCDGPESCLQSVWIASHCVYSVPSSTSSEFLSVMSYSMWGLTKIPFFIFASLIHGNICCR